MLAILAAVAMQIQPDFETWGRETTAQIQKDLYIPEQKLYAEEVKEGKKGGPAFMWACGVQLSALAAATKVDQTFKPRLLEYAKALDVYWLKANGISGYDVLPGPKSSDRYYDDNAWLVLNFTEIYEVTKDPKHLEQAKATMDFVLSGEDEKLGGGIYWHENNRKSKNTCSNAPSAAAALRLYQLTGEKKYLDIGERLVRWVDLNLQDPKDGLYWDNKSLDGKIEKTKWSYNTALMIRSIVLLSQIKKDKNLLKRAGAIATVAVAHWVKPNGAIADEPAFAHLFVDSLLFLHGQDKNTAWTNAVKNALIQLHEKNRDSNGRYSRRWDTETTEPYKNFKLIEQASAARAYWMAASFGLR